MTPVTSRSGVIAVFMEISVPGAGERFLPGWLARPGVGITFLLWVRVMSHSGLLSIFHVFARVLTRTAHNNGAQLLNNLTPFLATISGSPLPELL